MVPIKYNVRNLRVRWVTTLMTVLGTGLVVWATVLSFGLADGLQHALQISGDELDLIVLRKGSQDEVSSGVDQRVARDIATLDGIQTDAQGNKLCSAEFVTILTKPRRGDGGTTNVIVRGLEEVGRKLRPEFRIVEGRDINPGVNEAITSRRMAERFENTAIGEKLEINKIPFEIVGYFEAKGSAAESEVWTDIRDLTSARRTQGAVSCVNLRVRDGLHSLFRVESSFSAELDVGTVPDDLRQEFVRNGITLPENLKVQAEEKDGERLWHISIVPTKKEDADGKGNEKNEDADKKRDADDSEEDNRTYILKRENDSLAVHETIKQQVMLLIQNDEQFNLKCVDEVAYYKEQMMASNIVWGFGTFIAVFLVVGAMFAAANTMYAAVASRAREIGTMRALGFSRSSILISFLLESVLICSLGGLLGCLATLPFHGLSTGTANWQTFSEITFSFRFGSFVLLLGAIVTLAMGLVGGLFPAIRAVRLNIVKALREQ